MARRKKEPQSVHRKNISIVAEKLFMEKGINNTSMNDIARESGYSKATLYVYFKNKEELVGFLVLESMQKLYEYISNVIVVEDDYEKSYYRICDAMIEYKKAYPLYFNMVLDTINIDFDSGNYLPEEMETFKVGEKINALLSEYIQKGISLGILRSDIEIVPTIMSMWGMLSGNIILAFNKKDYLGSLLGKTPEEYLKYGFNLLYRAITK